MYDFSLENTSELQNNLKIYRQRKGMTQAEAARCFNISDSLYSRWENGDSEPRSVFIPIICNIYGITFEQLYGLVSANNKIVSNTEENFCFNKPKIPAKITLSHSQNTRATLKETAVLWNRSVPTIRKWCEKSRISAMKIADEYWLINIPVTEAYWQNDFGKIYKLKED